MVRKEQQANGQLQTDDPPQADIDQTQDLDGDYLEGIVLGLELPDAPVVAAVKPVTARALIQVLNSQIGYVEGEGNDTKYGQWYGHNPAPWCAMFIAWCAHEAELDKQIGKFSNAVEHAQWFAANGRFSHAPRVGAIAFFAWDGSGRIENIDHEGGVESVRSDGYVGTIEGNTGNSVARRVRNPAYIVGYGIPAYDKDITVIIPKTIAFGARGVAVRRAQRHLSEKGYRTTVDGVFGPITLERVREFQKDKRLTVDGVVGPLTWTKLLA